MVFSLCNYFILAFETLILLSFVTVPVPANLNLGIAEMTPLQHNPGACLPAGTQSRASACGLVLPWELAFSYQPL